VQVVKLLLVGVGGFFGAIARYGISGLFARSAFPTGTLAVNVLGCLAIGNLMGLVVERQFFSPETRVLWMTGFLGALTTFSTFGYETIELVREGSGRLALLNVAASVVLGLGAVVLGWLLVRWTGV
jgi:CrcB protein